MFPSIIPATYRTEGLLEFHQVNDKGCGADEEDLHEGVVETDEIHEEVQISHTEHDQIQLLSLA